MTLHRIGTTDSLSTAYDGANTIHLRGDNGSSSQDEGVPLHAKPSLFLRIRNGATSTSPWKYARMRTWVGDPQTSQNPHRGWRKAVFAATMTTVAALLAKTILAVIAATSSRSEDGVGVLFEGDCAKVVKWNTALHLVTNVLGTCLLSASSFTMQCLSSPTRSETDAAHASRRPLEIGMPSLTNLRHMHWRKRWLWRALCLSTIPLHLFWISTVFSTIGAMKLSYLVVDEGFLDGAECLTPDTSNITSESRAISSREVSDPAVFLKGYNDGNYTRLSPSDCIDAHLGDFITHYRNLILVTTPRDGMRMSPGMFFPTHVANLSIYWEDTWQYEGQYTFRSLAIPSLSGMDLLSSRTRAPDTSVCGGDGGRTGDWEGGVRVGCGEGRGWWSWVYQGIWRG